MKAYFFIVSLGISFSPNLKVPLIAILFQWADEHLPCYEGGGVSKDARGYQPIRGAQKITASRYIFLFLFLVGSLPTTTAC